MQPKIFGLVNPQGLIENTFYWNQDPDNYLVASGYSIVCIDKVENCGIGWSYIDGQFVEPPQPEEPEQPTSQGAQTL
jgi:hypothetical protein